MSFIKIKDPRKREELIKDLIETRKRIKDNFIARKVGEAEYQTGLTKLFKPVTETQKATAKEITEAQKEATERIEKGLLPIKEAIEGLPGVLTYPTLPALETEETEETEEKKILGDIAIKYLIHAVRPDSDKTFGIYTDENNKLKIGSKFINFNGNDIIIDGDIYPGTPGLWELIVSKNPENYKPEDYDEYEKLLIQTNAINQGNDPENPKPKSSSSYKWKNIIKPIWEVIKLAKKPPKKGKEKEYKEFEEPDEYEDGTALIDVDPKPGTSSAKGYGLKFLSSDPNALIDRFDLLFSSKKAGHTGVRNEIISILDELKRQKVINVHEYKKLNSLIKK